MRKVTAAIVVEVFRLASDGATRPEIAGKVGLGTRSVDMVLSRKAGAGVEVPPSLVAAARKAIDDRKRKLADADVVEAFRLRATGATQVEIAAKLGVTQKAVSDILSRRERRGVEVPARYLSAASRRRGRTRIPDEAVVEMFRLASTGMTQAEIAERFGTKQANVSAILRRASRAGVAVPAEYLGRGRRLPAGSRGERNANALLREKDIEDIFRLATWGTPDAEIAVRFGVTPSAIRAVLSRLTWKHVKVSPEYLVARR